MDGSSVTCEAHHAAPRCLLALHEKANVSASILEVLHAPLKAVVPTFLKVKPSEDDTSVTEREKEVFEIKQELELLRREMMPTFRTTPRPEKGSSELVREEVGLAPSPYDARQLIEVYLERGNSPSAILRRLVALGVSEAWAEEEITAVLAENKAFDRTVSRAAEQPRP